MCRGKRLRTHSFEQRCVAVVVDPLRQEHGIFTSERNAQNRHAGTANDKIKLSEDLQARYHKFLNRLRSLQNNKGKEEIPFILPGLLYQQRVAMGDADDIMDAKLQTLDKLNREIEQHQNRVRKLQNNVRLLEQTVTRLSTNLDDCLRLKADVKNHSSKIDKLGKRDDILLRMGQGQETEIKKLKGNVDVLFEALNQLNLKKEVQEEE